MGLLRFFRRFSKDDDGRRRYLDRQALTITRHSHRIPVERLDRNAVEVVERLQRHGHAAYLVGGCVRDVLIGRVPKDYDVVTDATPTEIKRRFPAARIIGRRFRIVHVPFGRDVIETATFRAIPPADGTPAAAAARADAGAEADDLLIRRDNVYGTEREDAARRDFTINALFYDPVKDVIIDYVGGYDDIKRKVIRIIGNPWVSYQEDPVRMIRALKFQATTGFAIEKASYTPITDLAEQIKKCATARVMEEIYKIMRSGVAQKAFHSLTATGLLRFLVPEVYEKTWPLAKKPEHFEESPLGRRLGVLDELVRRGRIFNNVVFLVVLFYDLVKEEIEKSEHPDEGYISNLYLTEISRRMAFSRKDKDMMVKVLVVQPRFWKTDKRQNTGQMKFLLKDFFKDALDFFEIACRVEGKGSDELLYWVNEYKRHLPAIKEARRERRGQPPERGRWRDRDREPAVGHGVAQHRASEAAEAADGADVAAVDATAGPGGDGAPKRRRRRGRRGGQGRHREPDAPPPAT